MAKTTAARSFAGILARVDRSLYLIERIIVAVATFVMTGVVFLSIVWNFFASPTGKIHSILTSFMEDSPTIELLAVLIGATLWLILCVFGVRTAKKELPWSGVVLRGLLLGAATLAGGKLLVIALPSGLVFSQRLALSLMMWVVMLGCSMAAYTRRHIGLHAIQKIVPKDKLRLHAGIGLVVAATFTLFLVVVGWTYAIDNLDSWIKSEHRAGVFESIAIPYWTVTIAVPLGFALTLARFVGHAVFIWRGQMDPLPTEEELQAARGDIGTDVDLFDEFARLVAEEEGEEEEEGDTDAPGPSSEEVPQ